MIDLTSKQRDRERETTKQLLPISTIEILLAMEYIAKKDPQPMRNKNPTPALRAKHTDKGLLIKRSFSYSSTTRQTNINVLWNKDSSERGRIVISWQTMAYANQDHGIPTTATNPRIRPSWMLPDGDDDGGSACISISVVSVVVCSGALSMSAMSVVEISSPLGLLLSSTGGSFPADDGGSVDGGSGG